MRNKVKETPDDVVCRYCQRSDGQTRAGLNRSGTHRYRCRYCERHYTPAPGAQGYPDSVRQQAVEMHEAGVALRRIGALLGVNHQSVVNWTRQHQAEAELQAAKPEPAPIEDLKAEETNSAAVGGTLKHRATIEDVARRAGVAASTVSNLLNDKGRMSAETRARVREAMDELHFTPNALVRAIRSRRTRILGVLMFDLDSIDQNVDHALTIPLLGGIYRAADKAGYDVLLYTGWPGRPERHSGLDFLNGHVDGLLWAVPPVGIPALERVAAAGLPVVTMLSRHVPEGVGYINGDNVAATRAIVAHLVAHGHRRIAFAGPARDSSSNYRDRREGYRQGLDDAVLPYDPALEANPPDVRRTGETVAHLIDEWMALPNPPTAIVAVTDAWAEAICRKLDACGFRVPGDIAVTGFDDVPVARLISGGLTTVRQPFAEIGSLAVDRLLALMDGASVDACRVTVPIRLITRATTGDVGKD